jgi:hypothetical protein
MKTLRKSAIFCMMIAFLSMSMQAPLMAGMIDNAELAMQAELQIQRDEVSAFKARDDVRSVLLDYGISSSDVDKRIANMTERELLQIQHQLADLPAGADGGALGLVLGIILILVILDILGLTNVFPNI